MNQYVPPAECVWCRKRRDGTIVLCWDCEQKAIRLREAKGEPIR